MRIARSLLAAVVLCAGVAAALRTGEAGELALAAPEGLCVVSDRIRDGYGALLLESCGFRDSQGQLLGAPPRAGVIVVNQVPPELRGKSQGALNRLLTDEVDTMDVRTLSFHPKLEAVPGTFRFLDATDDGFFAGLQMRLKDAADLGLAYTVAGWAIQPRAYVIVGIWEVERDANPRSDTEVERTYLNLLTTLQNWSPTFRHALSQSLPRAN